MPCLDPSLGSCSLLCTPRHVMLAVTPSAGAFIKSCLTVVRQRGKRVKKQTIRRHVECTFPNSCALSPTPTAWEWPRVVATAQPQFDLAHGPFFDRDFCKRWHMDACTRCWRSPERIPRALRAQALSITRRTRACERALELQSGAQGTRRPQGHKGGGPPPQRAQSLAVGDGCDRDPKMGGSS